MVNPTSIGNSSNDQINGVVGLSTSGRPPDSTEVVGKPPSTVTPDPPPAQGLQPAIERGQREKLVTFLDSDSVLAMVDVDFEDVSGHEGSQRHEGLTPSFKDKLIGMNNSAKGGKRRNVSIANNSRFLSRGSKPTNIEGSRFEILSQKPENVFKRADGSLNAGVLDREVEGAIMSSREGRAMDGKDVNVGKRIEILQRENVAPKDNRFNVAGSSKGRMVDSVKPAVGGSDSVGAINVELPTVAARGKVVSVDSMLPAARHSVIRVENDDGDRAIKSTKGRILPASIRGSQARSGTKV
ncbi:hypothetical protein V6N11_014334 [Hibiscus sabdariffa]|uniref:Uncharacterized protein n=2 Tax=Hibiscus sabdariffa TaxID=183260 RepID=A0ABR1ZCD4_9ROSI